MPQSINFPEANDTVGHENCYDMRIRRLSTVFGDRRIETLTSCWQFTAEEMKEFNENGGKVFFTFFVSQPIMSVTMALPVEEVKMYEWADIAQMMKDNLDTFTVVPHGDKGNVYVTFPGNVQFDFDKDQYQHVQNLYAEL